MRGYAHIGALRALERHEVPADCLAGSSIGATVAALYAGLGDLDRVEEILDGIGARMFRPTLSRKSLLTTAAMRRYVRRAFGDPALEELRIPLGVVATDVDTQDEVVLRRGSSVAAVFASAAVPGVFPAVRIGSHTLVDGGIVNPVPVTVAATMGADVVVGIRLVHGGGVQLDEISEAGEGPVPSAVAACRPKSWRRSGRASSTSHCAPSAIRGRGRRAAASIPWCRTSAVSRCARARCAPARSRVRNSIRCRRSTI